MIYVNYIVRLEIRLIVFLVVLMKKINVKNVIQVIFYFLPEGKEKNYCYSCGENCVSYQGKIDNSVCTQCKDGFKLIDGKCISKCNLGNNWDYSKTCDWENKNYYGSCFDGYYVSL